MNSEDLANHVNGIALEALLDYGRIRGLSQSERRVVDEAQNRILGVGDEQYSEGDKQKFETMPLDKLFEYAQEESIDLVNYPVMLILRLRELMDQYEACDDDSEFQENYLYNTESELLEILSANVELTIKLQGMRDDLARLFPEIS